LVQNAGEIKNPVNADADKDKGLQGDSKGIYGILACVGFPEKNTFTAPSDSHFRTLLNSAGSKC
jgi:hypothetical protein